MSDALASTTPDTLDAINLLASREAKVAQRLFTTDWSKHPLGPVETWPQTLRTMVHAMVASRFQMWLGWGPELYFFYNDAYAPTLGLKEARAFGTPFRQLWPEIWEDLKPRIDAVMQDGKATWDEGLLLFLERNGYPEETYHTFSYSPIRENDGRIAALFCTVTEVTDRVIAERRMLLLRELSAGLSAIRCERDVFDVVQRCLRERSQDLPFAAFYLFDLPAQRANLLRTHGLSADEALAPPSLPLDRDAVWPAAAIMKTGRSVTVHDLSGRFRELPRGPWNKPPRDAVLVPVAQQGQAGAAGFMVVGVNPYRPFDAAYEGFLELLAGQIAAGISSARAYEAERKRAEALAEIDRAKTTFFSNVSHELRTPLTLMLGPLEDIASQPGGDGVAKSRELATVAHRNALRLLKLVNTLLDFSRLEAGRMQAKFVATELGSFTADLASTFRSAIERAGLTFTVGCPPLPEPVFVDRDLWEKIVLNLLSNAYKFTLRGEIRVTLRTHNETIRLEVSDTGAGIPEAAQARLFERFYRIEGTEGRTQEGTGIGLALVRDLVKLHHGAIDVRSKVGQGTTFTVTIPRGISHLPAEQLVRTDRPPTESKAHPYLEEALRWDGDNHAPATHSHHPQASGARAGRVLLVDDNADMRDYVRRLLSERFEVSTGRDGQEALQQIEESPPDLILSDVMMPRLDGFGLVRALRANPKWHSIPIILLSARAGEEARVEGMERGADDYLVKPFSARELIARVSTHLELARVRRDAAAKVREAEERFRLAVDAAEVGTWAWDVPHNRVEWSERSLTIFGADASPAADGLEAFVQRVHPADRETASAALQATLENDAPYRIEVRIVRPNGQIRWIASQGKLFRDDAGKPVRLLGALIDVTERHLREQALRDTRARLAATLEAAAVGTWTWDMQNNRLLGDAGVFKLFSVRQPAEDIAPLDTLLPAIHADDLQRVRDSLARALRRETDIFEEDYRVIQPDGSHRWIASRGRFRAGEPGEAPVMSGVLIDITARKQIERALRQREELVSTIIDRSPFGVFLLDDALRVHHVNPRARPVFPATEVDGRDLREIVRSRHAPDEAAEVIAHYERTLATGESYFARATAVRVSVESPPVYLDWEIHRVSLPQGRFGLVCYFVDVTAHLVAQRNLQQSTARLEVALAAAKLGLWSWDAATDMVDFPDRAAEIFGIAAGPTMTWTAMQRLLEPADAELAKSAVAQAVAHRTDYGMEYRVNRPDGTQVHVSSMGRPVVAADGTVTGMIGVVQDITARKHAELHLRSQRDVLEQIVAGAPLSEVLESLTQWVEEFAHRKVIATILLMGEDGRRLHSGAGGSAPPEWTRYVDGLEIGPMVGSCGSAAYAREPVIASNIATDPRWRNFKDEALRHGLRACWSTPILASDASILGTFAIYYPEPAEPSQHEREIIEVVTRTASIAIERKRAEEALKQSRARLQEHAQLLEKTVEERTAKLRETIGELEAFSYSISHDMRAPLRSMYGYAELVIKDFAGTLPPDAVQYLRRITKNAARLELLVRDVLAYSKVAKEDIVLTKVDLDAFVPGLVGQMPELPRADLEFAIARPLPVVLAHEAYLSQIFTNLIGNSIKFARPGVPLKVNISAKATAPGWVRIEIRDNGIGIDPEHFQRIFEIFGRVYPDKKYEGTGIGLSIVKKAVQRMGGTIGVESSLGAGATFWFTLQTQ